MTTTEEPPVPDTPAPTVEQLLGKIRRLGARRAADLRELHLLVPAALAAGATEAAVARESRLARDTIRSLNGKERSRG